MPVDGTTVLVAIVLIVAILGTIASWLVHERLADMDRKLCSLMPSKGSLSSSGAEQPESIIFKLPSTDPRLRPHPALPRTKASEPMVVKLPATDARLRNRAFTKPEDLVQG